MLDNVEQHTQSSTGTSYLHVHSSGEVGLCITAKYCAWGTSYGLAPPHPGESRSSTFHEHLLYLFAAGAAQIKQATQCSSKQAGAITGIQGLGLKVVAKLDENIFGIKVLP